MKNNLFFSGLVALIVSLSSISFYSWYGTPQKTVTIEHVTATPSKSAVFTIDKEGNQQSLDFNSTAEKVLGAVVHIKSTHIYNGNSPNFQQNKVPDVFREFFGDEFNSRNNPFFRFESPYGSTRPNRPPAKVGTGSGVIISDDGYIVTNNHVIADADDLEVTLHDNRTYKATVIGTDPSTDLALIQIKEKNLPTVAITNSDNVNIGQWVLALGNPMGLNSTVTAGIVSAKGRNINILKDKYAVENFIQTDAAINPGNSGGALVNLEGSLVGINTAIASPTGSFAGYGFAIPSNIVSKVVKDLVEYGTVQRGVLGVMIRSVDSKLAKEKSLDLNQGVYVDSLFENSAAAAAGIKVGDIITSVNDIDVNTSPELQGMIASHRPGEEIKLVVNRNGNDKEINVTLNNREGNTSLSDKDTRKVLKILGAEFTEASKDLAKQLDIEGGIKVDKLYSGKLRKYTQMREGFIITMINGQPVSSVEKMLDKIESTKGGIMLKGVYEDIPGDYYYAFGM